VKWDWTGLRLGQMIGVLICANLQVVLQCHLKISWQFECVLSYQIVQRWSLESAVTKNCIMEDKETLNKPFWRIHLKKKTKARIIIYSIHFPCETKNFLFTLQYRSTGIRTEGQSQKYDYNRRVTHKTACL